MKVEVSLVVELGATTLGLVNALTGNAQPTAAKPAAKAATPAKAAAPAASEEDEEEKPAKTAAPAPAKPAAKAATPAKAAAPAKKAATPAAKAAEEETDFSELDDEAKLEEIKKHVTRHTKKGKSADIKVLLGFFDAGRASELDPENYDQFYDFITRYGNKESVEDIVNGDGEDLS